MRSYEPQFSSFRVGQNRLNRFTSPWLGILFGLDRSSARERRSARLKAYFSARDSTTRRLGTTWLETWLCLARRPDQLKTWLRETCLEIFLELRLARGSYHLHSAWLSSARFGSACYSGFGPSRLLAQARLVLRPWTSESTLCSARLNSELGSGSAGAQLGVNSWPWLRIRLGLARDSTRLIWIRARPGSCRLGSSRRANCHHANNTQTKEVQEKMARRANA